jgi:hypothetical protein
MVKITLGELSGSNYLLRSSLLDGTRGIGLDRLGLEGIILPKGAIYNDFIKP